MLKLSKTSLQQIPIIMVMQGKRLKLLVILINFSIKRRKNLCLFMNRKGSLRLLLDICTKIGILERNWMSMWD